MSKNFQLLEKMAKDFFAPPVKPAAVHTPLSFAAVRKGIAKDDGIVLIIEANQTGRKSVRSAHVKLLGAVLDQRKFPNSTISIPQA